MANIRDFSLAATIPGLGRERMAARTNVVALDETSNNNGSRVVATRKQASVTSNQIKKRVKALLPAAVLDRVQHWRARKYRPPAEIADFEQRYFTYQTSEPDAMTLRPGITLRIDPRSRQPFEWFCFRAPEMVREMDCFLVNA